MTGPRTVEELLFHMPTVERLTTDEWTKGFAASICRHSRRRGWTPSPKQIGMMRRVVSELFAHQEEGDLAVIED